MSKESEKQAAIDRMVGNWKSDWGPVTDAVCEATGLTRLECLSVLAIWQMENVFKLIRGAINAEVFKDIFPPESTAISECETSERKQL